MYKYEDKLIINNFFSPELSGIGYSSNNILSIFLNLKGVLMISPFYV